MTPVSRHPSVLAVEAALTAHATAGRVQLLPAEVDSVAAAAAALGVRLGQMVTSLLFVTDDVPLLVLASAVHPVDPLMVTALVEAQQVRRADPELVEVVTGQPVGGVAPVGHPRHIPTLVDIGLAAYDEVWATGGLPHAVFPTTYDELIRITAGTPAQVT